MSGILQTCGHLGLRYDRASISYRSLANSKACALVVALRHLRPARLNRSRPDRSLVHRQNTTACWANTATSRLEIRRRIRLGRISRNQHLQPTGRFFGEAVHHCWYLAPRARQSICSRGVSRALGLYRLLACLGSYQETNGRGSPTTSLSLQRITTGKGVEDKRAVHNLNC